MEIRYSTITKKVTGWFSRKGNHEVKLKNRPNEAIIELDIKTPATPLDAWVCDGKELTPNPTYVEPPPPRDTLKELDELKTRVANIETKAIAS